MNLHPSRRTKRRVIGWTPARSNPFTEVDFFGEWRGSFLIFRRKKDGFRPCAVETRVTRRMRSGYWLVEGRAHSSFPLNVRMLGTGCQRRFRTRPQVIHWPGGSCAKLERPKSKARGCFPKKCGVSVHNIEADVITGHFQLGNPEIDLKLSSRHLGSERNLDPSFSCITPSVEEKDPGPLT
jgi:hypothetical protein